MPACPPVLGSQPGTRSGLPPVEPTLAESKPLNPGVCLMCPEVVNIGETVQPPSTRLATPLLLRYLFPFPKGRSQTAVTRARCGVTPSLPPLSRLRLKGSSMAAPPSPFQPNTPAETSFNTFLDSHQP